MILVALLLALLNQPTPDPLVAFPEPHISAIRVPDGVYVSWGSPDYMCVKATGLNVDQFLGCGYTGTIRLDAGQVQYAGVGRKVGLWDGGQWVAGPIDLPGFTQSLPDVAAPQQQ